VAYDYSGIVKSPLNAEQYDEITGNEMHGHENISIFKDNFDN